MAGGKIPYGEKTRNFFSVYFPAQERFLLDIGFRRNSALQAALYILEVAGLEDGYVVVPVMRR